MHIQVRSKPIGGGSGFKANEPGDLAVTEEYPAGTLLDMLAVLRDAGFNLRAAGGPRVELGGEFAFWVGDPEKDDRTGGSHRKEASAAADILKNAGYDAWLEEVESVLLDDRPGTLREKLTEIAQEGLLVEEILVGTPGRDTGGQIPVQLRLVRLARS